MYKEYELFIGIEIHAELNTKTKMFCSCKNAFGGEVNTRCCPICLGLPGSLPSLNEEVLKKSIKAGIALNCDINYVTKFDRKHYFYPDLPKSYQISQYDLPLCTNGYLEFLDGTKIKKINIERIQMEEDSGKMIHEDTFNYSLIDYNRSGVPLIEIISAPDIKSSKEAKLYLENIRRILMDIDVCDGKMSEGSIRCDVNISVKKPENNKLGTRVEFKNINTFSGAVRAIENEYERQVNLLKSGIEINQETRKWDDINSKSIPLRTKENAIDYKFFKEPDLEPIKVDENLIEKCKLEIPELSNYKFIKFVREYGLSEKESLQLINSIEKCKFFESILSFDNSIPSKIACNWVLGYISEYCNANECEIKDTKLNPQKICELINLIKDKKISNTMGKEIFDQIVKENKDIKDIVEKNNMTQINDIEFLENIANKIIKENINLVDEYKNGKTNVIKFLVGQCMKECKGKGNPAILHDKIIELITSL